ncbi:MAG: efflux RND transporter permease subunit [Balneolales bacterium]|nr:efflux RND transporter permease subunit [Balneolales bacterium]
MKKLSKLAVERPVTFIMMTLIVIGFGLFGLSRLSLNLYPDVSFPTITVYTTYEGVAPEDIETLITRPIEEQVGSVSGLRRVRSLSSQGASVIKLYFNWGTDIFIAESDVRKQLDFARRAIPQDADQPIVFSYDPNQEPVLVLALSSPVRNPSELRTIATQQLEQRLERISGIAAAETAGGLERQINIWIRSDRLLAFNLDIATVSNRLRQENIQVPAGELIEGRIVYSLRTIGEFRNLDEIRTTVVGINNDIPILLEDIADIEDGVAQPIGNVHVRGEEGLIINLYRQSDVNIVTTAASVVAEIQRIRSILPSDVNLEILTNRADFIRLSLNNLYMTAIQAIVLVMIILLLFLRSFRTALIIAISIPISIIATFSVMDFADVTLNVISLSGLTLAVGLVVDNAVVVLENIFRFREDGHNGKKAAILGAQEVATPVIVSTLTTLVVLLPVLFVPGIAGFLFQDLALTVSFALIMSTLAALSIIPLLSSQFFSREDKRNKSGADAAHAVSANDGVDTTNTADSSQNEMRPQEVSASSLSSSASASASTKPSSSSKNPVVRTLERFFNGLEARYTRVLETAIGRSKTVVIGAILLFVAVFPLYYTLGGEFFPPVDENAFILNVQREPGVNLFELQNTIYQVEDIIQREVPEARLIVSDYGDKRGVEGADNPGGYQGTVRVELVPRNERRRGQFEISSAVLRALQDVPGANIREVRENPLNPDGNDGLIVNVYGFDMALKKDLASGIRESLLRVDGIIGATSSADEGRPELQVVMNRERISRLNMTTSQVASAVSNAVRGSVATTFVERGVEYSVLVQLAAEDRADSRSLEDIQIRTPGGVWMPLSNLARIERYQGPSNILRINQERVTEIAVDIGDLDLRTATVRAEEVLQQVEWPDGYRYDIGGTAEEQAESFRFLLIAFLIAAILAYMVMASQFESLIEPFIIIVTIPLALTGVLLILFATSTPVSVTAMIGLILLAGIVVNNGIVMIDYIKVLQARGVERREAVIRGAVRRLRPILMTAATTILSMVPLALELGAGSETWSPMARTVIGGLTMSTILMLLVVPCLYYLINGLVERLGFDAVHKIDPLNDESDDEPEFRPATS